MEKFRFILGVVVALAFPAAGNFHIDTLYQKTRVNIQDYENGADFRRDRELYLNNYHNDGFWKSFWTAPTQEANWAQQARMLIIHASNAIEHLQASIEFFRGYTLFSWGNNEPLTIRQRYNYGYRYNYYFEVLVNNKLIFQTNYLQFNNNFWTNVLSLWIASKPDPNGALIPHDYNIIQYTVFNASEWQLATAKQGSGAPDSSYLSLWQTNDPSGLSNTVSIPDSMAGVFHADHDQIYAAMQQAGLILTRPPKAQPSDAIIELRNIYTNNRLEEMRCNLMKMLFDMFINSGYWVQQSWDQRYFNFRSIIHTAAYQLAYEDYKRVCQNMITQYNRVIQFLMLRLEDNYQENLRILRYIDAFREDRLQQRPLAAAITEAQARSLFLQQVGDMTLKNIPYISIAAYMPWIAGPPWAETPCFPSPWGCTPNPLYHTIVAQLIRGLDRTGGVVLMPQNAAYNSMKNEMQQDTAVQTIIDLANKTEELKRKQSWLQQLSTNKVLFWGDRSHAQSFHAREIPRTAPVLMLQNTQLNNTVSILEQLRERSLNNLNQTYEEAAGQGTLLERQSLRTRQEADKAGSIQELNEAFNQKALMRAQERNRQHMQEQDAVRRQKSLNFNQVP